MVAHARACFVRDKGPDHFDVGDGLRALALMWSIPLRVMEVLADLDEGYRAGFLRYSKALRVAKSGDYSLSIFLVLTTFLLTTAAVRHFRRTGQLDWASLAAHRLLRVWPTLALTTLLLWAFGFPPTCAPSTWDFWSNWLLIANFAGASCKLWNVCLIFQVGRPSQ